MSEESEEKRKFVYRPQSDEELEKLAWDIIGGRVWGTWAGPDAVDSFTILKLLSKDQLQELVDNRITHVYEYLEQAGPMSMNGMPMFLSCHYLNSHDAIKLQARINELREFKNKRAQDAKSNQGVPPGNTEPVQGSGEGEGVRQGEGGTVDEKPDTAHGAGGRASDT